MKILTAMSFATIVLMAQPVVAGEVMEPKIRIALENTCKAAISDSGLKLRHTLKSFRLKAKEVALKVNCNGTDIISFAEQNGAENTASYLASKIGNVSVSEIAMSKKLSVTVPVTKS